MKNTQEGFLNRLDQAEERINELNYREENSSNQNIKKNMKKSKYRLMSIWDNVK